VAMLGMGFRCCHDRREPGIVRFLTSFSTTAEEVAEPGRAAYSAEPNGGRDGCAQSSLPGRQKMAAR
jgi:hypothetical protein